jgi:hypothetical protein
MPLYSTAFDFDLTNKPSEVTLNGVILPMDVIIGLNGEKVIAESKILDGVSVFERVSRKPFEINFDFNIRELKSDKYIFPNATAAEIVTSIWELDQVINCKNTFLNKIGINDIIIKSITFMTIRGNTNLICSLKCLENYNSVNQKTTLIISA